MIPYPEYKPSGLAWLEQLPRHWVETRVKRLFQEVDEHSSAAAEARLLVSPPSGVTRCEEEETETETAEEVAELRLCQPGDLVFSLAEAHLGALGVAPIRGLLPASCVVFRQREAHFDPEFLNLLCRLPSFVYEYRRRAQGPTRARVRLLPEDFLDLPILCPPLAEQRLILEHLRRQGEELNRLVANKHKTIALLREQKAAFIHGVVTRGLRPNAPQRPSGLSWLEAIPAHWEVQRLGLLARIGVGVTPSRHKPAYWLEGAIPWLTSAAVEQDYIVKSEHHVTEKALFDCRLPRLPADTTLVALDGEGSIAGSAALLMFPATINQHLAALTPITRRLSPHYLHALLTGLRGVLRLTSARADRPRGTLTRDDLSQLSLPIPPVAEQSAILQHLEEEGRALNNAMAIAVQELALFEEYHTAMNTAALHGQLDFRAPA